jgi:hypothetical protein
MRRNRVFLKILRESYAFRLFLLLILFSVNSCSTKPIAVENDESIELPRATTKNSMQEKLPQTKRAFEFDLDELEKKLNLGSKFDELGFHQKRFTPCAIGYQAAGCDSHYFTMINFQIVCRDTTETTESSDHILTPLANKDLELRLNKKIENVQTDSEGFTQMRLVSNGSVSTSRLIILSSPNSLGLRAGDTKKIMVPRDWCE